jgi:hypothetical protein
MESPNVDGSFRGLALDEEIVRKIYSANAQKWYGWKISAESEVY